MNRQISLAALALTCVTSLAAQNAARPAQTEAPTVVTGHISINGAPFDNAEVFFWPIGDLSEPPHQFRRVRTNPSGDFRAGLDGPGRFVVLVSPAGRSPVGAPRTVTEFGPGPSQFNLNIDGGTIAVRLVDWDGSPATIHFERKDGSLSRSNETIRSGSENPYVLRGVAFGTYSVSVGSSAASTDVRGLP